MSDKYHRLCAEDREVIANMKQAGKKQIEIAQAIGFSQSVISKELSRNHGEKPYQTRMLLQVHDELVFDLAREEED